MPEQNLPVYDHACSFMFSIRSNHPKGEDISGAEFKAAVRKRLDKIDDDEMIEACWPPHDTFMEDDESAVGKIRERWGVNESLAAREKLHEARKEADHEQELYDEGRLKDE